MYVEKIKRLAVDFSFAPAIFRWLHLSQRQQQKWEALLTLALPGHFSSWCRHFLPAQGHRWPSDVDPSVMSCGWVHRGWGGALCFWEHNVGVAWYLELLLWDRNNEVMCYSALWYWEQTGLLRGNATRKLKVLLEGCSQFDATVIFINTQIPPCSANENQRFSEMKKVPVLDSKAWELSRGDSVTPEVMRKSCIYGSHRLSCCSCAYIAPRMWQICVPAKLLLCSV